MIRDPDQLRLNDIFDKKYEFPIEPAKNVGIANYGWICPKCGRGNSPFLQTCPCHPDTYKITCGIS